MIPGLVIAALAVTLAVFAIGGLIAVAFGASNRALVVAVFAAAAAFAVMSTLPMVAHL